MSYCSHLYRITNWEREKYLKNGNDESILDSQCKLFFKNRGIDIKSIFFQPHLDYNIVTDINNIQYQYFYKDNNIIPLTCPSCGESHDFSNLNWKGQCDNTVNKINNNIKKLYQERFNK